MKCGRGSATFSNLRDSFRPRFRHSKASGKKFRNNEERERDGEVPAGTDRTVSHIKSGKKKECGMTDSKVCAAEHWRQWLTE